MLWVGSCLHLMIGELNKVEKVILVISAGPFVFKSIYDQTVVLFFAFFTVCHTSLVQVF